MSSDRRSFHNDSPERLSSSSPEVTVGARALDVFSTVRCCFFLVGACSLCLAALEVLHLVVVVVESDAASDKSSDAQTGHDPKGTYLVHGGLLSTQCSSENERSCENSIQGHITSQNW